MGTAKTIGLLFPNNAGLREISKITALCRAMGYKAVDVDSPLLVPLFCGFWADALEVLDEVLMNLENDQKINEIINGFVPVVRQRLEWLAKKIQVVAPQQVESAKELNDVLNELFK